VARELVESAYFACDGLRGYICGGHEHGVELTAGRGGRPVTRRMCLNLEHYYARERAGLFVPRLKAEVTSELLGRDAFRVAIAPFGDWLVRSTITYRLPRERVIEAQFEFAFQIAYEAFEAFISNYFYEPTEPTIHAGGRWFRPQIGDYEHRYWARSDRDARDIEDGRLAALFEELEYDYEAPVDPQRYDYPVMITPVGDSGWSVVHLVEKAACPSISINRTWSAHDFSLVGRDVAKGETVTCRAWMAYAKLDSPDQALSLYEDLCAGDR